MKLAITGRKLTASQQTHLLYICWFISISGKEWKGYTNDPTPKDGFIELYDAYSLTTNTNKYNFKAGLPCLILAHSVKEIRVNPKYKPQVKQEPQPKAKDWASSCEHPKAQVMMLEEADQDHFPGLAPLSNETPKED